MYYRVYLTAIALLVGFVVTALWMFRMGPYPPYWWIGAILLAAADIAGIVAIWWPR